MLEWSLDWWDVSCILGVMGISTCLILWLSQTLAGISEIEEAQASHDSTTGKSSNLDLQDSTRLQARDDCKERVRASRSPVRPTSKQRKAPRRSLSLPSGGLSYGDIKILYKDGHFVMVDTSADKAVKSSAGTDGMLEDVSEENEKVEQMTDVHPGDSECSGKDVSEDCGDIDSKVRAEILSLLERGITDPQWIHSDASLNFDIQDTGVGARRTKTGAPVFLSLPRRKGQRGQRPVSVDEAKLWKYYSKSQQSLVGQAELERSVEEKQGTRGTYKDSSGLKRNVSFSEAIGSTVVLNDANGREGTRDPENAELCDSGFDDSNQKQAMEESRANKSRSKGQGFFQRMLQKRKGSGSEKSLSALSTKSQQKNELSSSSVSLASISSINQQQTHTGKRDNRDSSIGRKMSFRGIFKRKNSTDETLRKTSTSEDYTNPPGGTLHSCDDDNRAASPDAYSQKYFNQNMEEADVFQEGLFGVEVDSFSHSHISSRSPRTPLSNSSSQSSLYCSLSQDDNDSTPVPFQSDGVGHRARNSSGRSRNHGEITSGERLSGDSFSEYDLSSPDLRNSDGTLTPRSVSPCMADMTVEGDQTLLASPSHSDRLSPPVYQKLPSSPLGGRRKRSREGETFQKGSAGYSNSSLTTSSRSVEMVSRNSNDSGIQNDGNVNSSAESIQAAVKLRKSKSPSPTSDRPKSDTTVRWADLLEQVMESSTVRFRQDANRLRKQPRPRSDIDEKMSDEESDEDVDIEDGNGNDECDENCQDPCRNLRDRRSTSKP